MREGLKNGRNLHTHRSSSLQAISPNLMSRMDMIAIWEVMSRIKRPKPSPVFYGPAMLLLLAACGGGGGSAPEPLTGGVLLITSRGRPEASTGPVETTSTSDPPPDNDDRPTVPVDPPDNDVDEPSTPIDVVGGAAVSDISVPEINWQASPENIIIRKEEDLLRPDLRVNEGDEVWSTRTGLYK